MAFAPWSKLNKSSSATAASGWAPARLTTHQLLPGSVRAVRTRVRTGRSCRPPRFASFAANARRPCHNKHPPRRRCATALATMDTRSSPFRPARIVAGARRRSNRQPCGHGHENDACPVPLMAAAAAAFGSGPAPTHDPAAGNPSMYTAFTCPTGSPTVASTSNPATAEHGSGFQFADGDEAMYFGPIDHDYIKPQLVTVTSTSVAHDGASAFVVHDITNSGTGKTVDAVPRHRLRRLAKMPAAVVKQVPLSRAGTAPSCHRRCPQTRQRRCFFSTPSISNAASCVSHSCCNSIGSTALPCLCTRHGLKRKKRRRG